MCGETELEQVGFDAVAEALNTLYPDQDGIFYRAIIPYALGGNDPLDGVQVFKSERGMPHWHYVTYGFTELYEKETDNPEESGYGFELTFRLKRGGEEQPPAWPINLLQNLARYVFSSGNVFGSGHHMSCNGPIALEEDTELTALGFRTDTELGEMDTPNGHMAFIQAVGITDDEMSAMMCWNGEKFLASLELFLPLCITDLPRPSLMKNPEVQGAWKKGVEADGSSTGFLYLDEVGAQLQQERATIRLGAGHDVILANMLRARVGKGRSLYLQSKEAAVLFELGERFQKDLRDGILHLTLTKAALEELCDLLKPHAGVYPLRDIPLTLELVPTKITDQDGNVLKVIG